jgi:hypothetical protein
MMFIGIMGLMLRESRYKKQTCGRFFMWGLMAHLLGTLAFDAVYVFYYGGGDTTEYHRGASIIAQTLLDNFDLGWQLMTTDAQTKTLQTSAIIGQIGGYYEAPNTLVVLRIAAIFQLISFGSFWISSLWFGCMAFLGLWAFYRVTIDMYPALENEMAMAVIFIPSVIFWGSGIMKDTLCMAFLGSLLYGVYHLLIKRDQFFLPLLLIPISAVLIALLKAYIIMGFVPALIYWLISILFSNIKDKQLRRLTSLSLLLLLSGLIYFNLATIYWLSDNIMQEFIKLAISFQSWHGFLTEVLDRSSGYSLGEIEFTPWGILKKFPNAVNITLFRPYITDVNSPIMLFSFIESSLLMLGTVYVLWQVGMVRTWRIIVNNPFAMFCLIFTLIFAFAVGFASYNFGALVRYKIPCLPFYAALLFIVPFHYRQMKLAQNGLGNHL